MDYDFLRKEKMQALKEKDTLKNSVITMLLSGLTYKKKELGHDPGESDCYEVIAKELKQTKEAYDLAKDRPEVAEELAKKMAILEGYMPKQLSAEEVKAQVSAILADAGIELSAKNKGVIMKTVMAALKGKADGKVISQCVNELLN